MPEELARFELGGGEAAVYVAFEDQDPEIVRARSRDRPGSGAVEVAAGRFEEGIDRIREMAGRTLERMVSLPAPPSTVELEFGVKFNVETGAVIARTGVEGHLKVKMVWERGEQGRRAEEVEAASVASDSGDQSEAQAGAAGDG
ncbi:MULTISPECIES: CU044_2847 family protein [Streptomyces]|uniref:CU044_2847 family protein n=1 Tax=Streptomyces TaxID=1883 RepID=UPI0004AFDCB2|nr:CU044_2847 family protein [Streptomyces exfoliatus]